MKFQWSKAAALFGDYADFIKAYNLSIQSTGFSEGQIAAQMDTISRKAEQLKATLTGVLSGAGDSGLSVAIKGMLTSVNDFLKGLQQIPASTYQSVGAIAKLGVEAYAGFKSLSFLVSGITGMRNAILTVQAAKAADTASTVANTSASNVNATAKVAGAAASRGSAVAVGAEAAAKEVDTAATAEATAATGAWATATTIATGGVNLLIAGLIAAAVGTASYTESLGEEANAADTMAQKNSDAIAIKEQEVEMTEKQTEFIGTLGNAYIELSARLEQVKGNEEETNKTKKDLEATENELAKIVGEDGLERIKTSDDVSQAIQDEKKAHSEKTESIKNDLANLKKQQIEFTRQQLQGTVDRIDALKSEATAWTRFMDIVAGALDMYIGAQKFIFDHMPNFMQAQKSMLARSIDENTSYRESLRGGRSISTNNEIAELEQKKAEQEIKLAKLQISDETGYVPPSTTQTGGDEVPEETPKKKKGAGRTPVDNSNERIAYDFFVRAGYSKELAAGLVGNFMTESPGLIPTAWNESGTSYGIGQWQDSRLQGLYDFANTNKSDYSSLDTQLAYAVYELQHGESGSLSKVLASNPTTPEEAAYAFAKYYERPAVPENFERQQNARDIYGRYAMGEGGKYEALDPAKQREKFYSDMKKSFDEELQAEKNTALEQGRFWKANDTLYLFKTMLGEVGKDIPAYETERLKLQQEKQKEDQAILAATYARQEALTTAGVDNVKKAEEEIKAAVSAKQPLSGAQEKIYENMLKSGIAPKGSPEKLKADTDEYKEIFSRNNAIHKEEESVLKKHTSILESITDSETQFAQKLHMLSSEEVLQRNAQINESKYQQQLPELQAGLSKTAKTGNESAMLDAYKAFQNAKTAEDAKASIKTMASLSKDEVATLKAVSAMQEAYEKYATKREQLSEQEFERENRYQISFINAYQSAWSDALDSTLNKTRSFAENARNIFKSLFSALTKQLSTDFAQKWTQSLSKIMLASKSTSQQTKTDNQSMATQIEQNAAQVTAKAIQSDTQRKQSSQQLAVAEQQASSKTKVSVLANIGTMLSQMLAEMAIMYALSAIFGGGGSSTSTSTSTVSLGRNPASYYKAPPTISQVTVPSMDIGGELPSDQLILAHKKEWVLTPDQISSLQAAGKSATSTSNNSNSMVFHSNFSPSLIDSRGIKDVYAQTRKDMIKTIKREVRGFNTTTVT